MLTLLHGQCRRLSLQSAGDDKQRTLTRMNGDDIKRYLYRTLWRHARDLSTLSS